MLGIKFKTGYLMGELISVVVLRQTMLRSAFEGRL